MYTAKKKQQLMDAGTSQMNGVENINRKHETEIRLIRESPDPSGSSRENI